MKRRAFIVNTCVACVSVTALSGLLTSCAATRYRTGTVEDNGLSVPLDYFKKNGETNAFLSYVIISNDLLKHPICVYRFNEKEYAALWMRCSHQGAELQVNGDYLQCPAHGSEFNNKGKVTSGPASEDLRSFPVMVGDNELFIDLRQS